MIALFRSSLFLFLAVLITAPAGLLVTLSVVLPMRCRFAIIAAWRTLFMGLCDHVLGLRYEVIGRENIPSTPSVILSKHQSAWDTFGLVPLFLFSGTFFPVEQLPDWLEPLAWVTPLWHGVELCRDLATGEVEAVATMVHVTYLVAVTALGAFLAVRAQRGKLLR